MPKSPPPYPPELRRRLVELVRAGRSPTELAKEFEPSEQCIRNWVKQLTAEKDELVRLRRDVRTLREERAILAKAAAWFARETGKIPPGSTNS